jgi:HEPN domain-containing protein
MVRLRRDTRRFKRRAINSLLLAIEMFNRPHEAGRTEAVLMLLQHAFEMCLKAAIYEKRRAISDSRASIKRSNMVIVVAGRKTRTVLGVPRSWQ